MKKQFTLIADLLLIFLLLFGSAAAVNADDYSPVHTEEELTSLFTQVKDYLDENGETLTQQLDDTQNRVVTSALIRAWGITQIDDAYPWEIDDAYDEGFSEGYDAGNEEGYSSGHAAGYEEGLSEGFDRGYHAARVKPRLRNPNREEEWKN